MVSVLLLISALAFLSLDQFIQMGITLGVLLIWVVVFQALDFRYIFLKIETDAFVLRYYTAVKFGRKDYQTIEFHPRLLHDFTFESSFFGLITDLTLVVNTSRGIAEYPSVSLAALDAQQLIAIRQALEELIHK